jgi:osmotically inducible protein OsmC
MKLIIRKASVRWRGGSGGGRQAITTESGALRSARFSSGIPLKSDSQTDPAELIAAAHAASFSLALSNELKFRAGAADQILTTATVAMERLPAGWTIVNIHLNVLAALPGMTQGRFIDATVRAKTSCVVSRLLRASISMDARLENHPKCTYAAPTHAPSPGGPSGRGPG